MMKRERRFSSSNRKSRGTVLIASAMVLVTAVVAGAGCFPEKSLGGSDLEASANLKTIFRWNTFASNLVAANLPAGPQTYALAISHIAIHDAINAVQPKFQSYVFNGSAPEASFDAAVAAAAHDTLSKLVAQAAGSVETEYQAALAAIPDGRAKEDGISVGQQAAAAILARRSNDDIQGAIIKPYTPGAPGPGVYQPTPPTNITILAGWGGVSPFALNNPTQFRSNAPLDVASAAYAVDFNEVKGLGRAVGSTRTAEQSETAQFWYDAATKEWNFAAQKGLADVGADGFRAARTLAAMNVALADAAIVSFETKFQFNYWRPFTAIRAGETDGNPSTSADPTWESFCVTPPFPEYNSTHAATAAAAAGVLSRELGDKHTFTVASPTLAGKVRTYERFSDAAQEEAVSRIYCGIHFRHAMNEGLSQGNQVAAYVQSSFLLKR